MFLKDELRPETLILTNQLNKAILFSQQPRCRYKKQMAHLIQRGGLLGLWDKEHKVSDENIEKKGWSMLDGELNK